MTTSRDISNALINKINSIIIFIDINIKFIKMLFMNRLPVLCPSCRSKLAVKRLRCDKCETEIEGIYALPPLAGLAPDDQEFIVQFIKASGSLKEMASILGVSYPTVRNRLDEIIEELKRSQGSSREKK